MLYVVEKEAFDALKAAFDADKNIKAKFEELDKTKKPIGLLPISLEDIGKKVDKMCRLYSGESDCRCCPLADKPAKCYINIANVVQTKQAIQTIAEWQPPTNADKFCREFGDKAFYRLMRNDDFASWAGGECEDF